MEEEKKEHTEHHDKKSFTEKVRENPWILSTLICGALVIVLLISTFSGGLTGNVSKEKATENLISYAKLQGVNIAVNGVKEETGLYNLDAEINGQATNIYLTKDGKNIVSGGLIPITTPSTASSSSSNTQQTEVPKSDKPKVELYVFTYCPYGLQMEKAFAPVIKLLGSKIDFRIRQIGAMHGDFEKVEAQRQLCIEKNYADKYLSYVSAFAADTSCQTGDAACVATKVNGIYSTLGIDASKINSCMTTDGLTMYNSEVSNSQANSVSGSPTLIINGVQSQASRSPEGVKGAICSAFNNVPSECSQTLDTNQASAGFGTGSSSSSSAGVQCG